MKRVISDQAALARQQASDRMWWAIAWAHMGSALAFLLVALVRLAAQTPHVLFSTLLHGWIG